MGRYESPSYKTIIKEGKFEIRAYDAFYTTAVKEDQLKGYHGFQKLFGYISGKNNSNQKISMTVPVINDFQASHQTMEFVLPKSYENHTPQPIDQDITIKYYKEALVAVIKFNGTPNPVSIDQNIIKLSQWITQKGFLCQEGYRLARYNPPFIPGFFKKNEILISLQTEDLTDV